MNTDNLLKQYNVMLVQAEKDHASAQMGIQLVQKIKELQNTIDGLNKKVEELNGVIHNTSQESS